MGVDIYRSRRTLHHKCYWWSVNRESRADASAIRANEDPSGVFYACDESQRQRREAEAMGAISYETRQITIRTEDVVDGIKPRDVVEFDGTLWRVANIQQRDVHRQTEFSRAPSVTTYLTLEA